MTTQTAPSADFEQRLATESRITGLETTLTRFIEEQRVYREEQKDELQAYRKEWREELQVYRKEWREELRAY